MCSYLICFRFGANNNLSSPLTQQQIIHGCIGSRGVENVSSVQLLKLCLYVFDI